MNDKTKEVVAEIERDLAETATPLGESEVAAGVMAGAVVGAIAGLPGAAVGAIVGGAAAVVAHAVAAHEHEHDNKAVEDKEEVTDEIDIDDRPTPTTPGGTK